LTSDGAGANGSDVLTPRLLQAAVVLAGAAAGAAVGGGVEWVIAAGAIGSAALLVVGLVQPALFLLIVLLVRPLLDRFEASKVHVGGGLALNVAGALALILLVVAVKVFLLDRRREWPRPSLAFAAVLLVSVAAAGVALAELRAQEGGKPIEELVRLAALAAAYFLAANVAGETRFVKLVFVGGAFAAVVPAIVGIRQWLHLPHAEDLSISRIYGTFTGPNPYGAYLAAAMLILLFLPADWLPRWARIGALVVTGAALVGSFSRTGWSMLFLGLVYLGWRDRKRVIAAVIVVALALGLAVPSVRHRVFSNGSVTSPAVPSSYHWRIGTWRDLLSKYEQRPLIGFGLRSAPYVNPRRRRLPGQPVVAYDAHNTVVKLLVEGGPLLLGAWVWFFAVVLIRFRRLARSAWELQPAARIVLCLWGIVAFIGITDDDLLAATALMLVVFTLSGAVEGAWRRAEKESEQRRLA
jgi:O-antigen ligase